MNSMLKRSLALLLSLLLVFGASFAAFADDEGGDPAEEPVCTMKLEGYENSVTVKYKDTVSFTASVMNLPEGSSVMWVVNDELVKDENGEPYTGYNYTVEEAISSFTVKAIAVREDGYILANTQLVTVTVKISFFTRLLIFLKILFAGIPILRIRVEKDS